MLVLYTSTDSETTTISEPGIIELSHLHKLDWVSGGRYEIRNRLNDRDIRWVGRIVGRLKPGIRTVR